GASFNVAGPKLANVKVQPNPWRKDKHNGFPITFSNLVPGTTVKVFTVSAHLVAELPPSAGSTSSWDLKNNSGDNVASGIYIWLATSVDGQTDRGKMAIIR